MSPKTIALVVAVALAGGTFLACGKDNPAAPDAEVEDELDASVVDGGVIDADCVMNPVTSAQIMNACTTAQRIEKHPSLPLQLEDGGLPPLP